MTGHPVAGEESGESVVGRDARLARIAVLVVAGVLVTVALAGTASATVDAGTFAHGNTTDTEPPELTAVRGTDPTTINVTFTDNHDVDEGSIDNGSFLLQNRDLAGVTVEEDGRNATAILSLAAQSNFNSTVVALASGSSVSDTNGNVIPADEQSIAGTARGMDGLAPGIEEFTVTNATGSPARISVTATEELTGLNLTLSGAGEGRLRIADFAYAGSRTYRTTYVPPADGTLVVELNNVTDSNGNQRGVYRKREVTADLTGPDAVAGIDFAASGNLSLTFDAGRSTDPGGISNYTWAFGDGTSATGERVNHTFAPGVYTVTLTAEDRYGNVGTDAVELNLTSGAGDVSNVTDDQLDSISRSLGPNVSITRASDSPGVDAFVRVDRAVGGTPVGIGGDGTPLVRQDALSLGGLDVTPAANGSFNLAVSPVTDAADSPADVTTLGSLTVVTDVPDDGVENVTFSFAVETARLDDLGVGAAKVSLFRRADGAWTRLPTTVVETGPSTARFRARSPGFSLFVAAANATEDEPAPTATPTPDSTPAPPTATPTPRDATDSSDQFAVLNASLNASSVPQNGTVLVNAFVENRGAEFGTYVAGLSVNGTVVATRAVPIRGNQTGAIQFSYAANATGTFPVAVNGTSAGTLTVGGGGGILGSIAGIFGFLPLGLLQPVIVFLGIPLVVIYLILKALAIYLGY
jgi:hypothetical protein